MTTTGIWQHFAVVAKAGTGTNGFMAIYRNGLLMTNKSGGVAFVPGAYNLQLSYSNGLNGQLDDFRVWSKARSQAEIADDMLHPLTGTEPNLVAYWSFDDSSGTLVRDSTLNHHDGILTNGTTRVSSSISAPNLSVNPGFEQGTSGWWPFGPTTLKNSSFWMHSGASSVLVSNRTDTWQGLQ